MAPRNPNPNTSGIEQHQFTRPDRKVGELAPKQTQVRLYTQDWDYVQAMDSKDRGPWLRQAISAAIAAEQRGEAPVVPPVKYTREQLQEKRVDELKLILRNLTGKARSTAKTDLIGMILEAQG